MTWLLGKLVGNPAILPWLLVAVVLAIGAAGASGAYYGHQFGVDSQKVADQKQFDQVNADLTARKADANKLLQDAAARNMAIAASYTAYQTKLEAQQHEAQQTNDDLRRKYSGLGLRFRTTEGPGCGSSGSGALPTSTAAAGLAASPDIQLPDSITRNLRELAYQCDQLAANYRVCYAGDQQVGVQVPEAGQ